MLYTLVLQFYLKKVRKREKVDDTFLRKKPKEKQNNATIIICVNGKGTVFQWSWNHTGNRLNKDINKENFKKRSYEFNSDKSPD